MNTRWKEVAGDMLKPKLTDIYSQETSTWLKGQTIESDSKQKIMSCWSWTESSSSSTSPEIETSHWLSLNSPWCISKLLVIYSRIMDAIDHFSFATMALLIYKNAWSEVLAEVWKLFVHYEMNVSICSRRVNVHILAINKPSKVGY